MQGRVSIRIVGVALLVVLACTAGGPTGQAQRQAATGDPTKVYAAVFGAATLGLVLFGLVVLFDVIVMRNRPRESSGSA